MRAASGLGPFPCPEALRLPGQGRSRRGGRPRSPPCPGAASARRRRQRGAGGQRGRGAASPFPSPSPFSLPAAGPPSAPSFAPRPAAAPHAARPAAAAAAAAGGAAAAGSPPRGEVSAAAAGITGAPDGGCCPRRGGGIRLGQQQPPRPLPSSLSLSLSFTPRLRAPPPWRDEFEAPGGLDPLQVRDGTGRGPPPPWRAAGSPWQRPAAPGCHWRRRCQERPRPLPAGPVRQRGTGRTPHTQRQARAKSLRGGRRGSRFSSCFTRRS